MPPLMLIGQKPRYQPALQRRLSLPRIIANGNKLVNLPESSANLIIHGSEIRTDTDANPNAAVVNATSGVGRTVQLPIEQLGERVRNELGDNAALEESYGDGDEHFGNETDSMRDGDNGGSDAADENGDRERPATSATRSATMPTPTMCPTICNNGPTMRVNDTRCRSQGDLRPMKTSHGKSESTTSTTTSAKS